MFRKDMVIGMSLSNPLTINQSICKLIYFGISNAAELSRTPT